MKKFYSIKQLLILGGLMISGLASAQVVLNQLEGFGVAIYDINKDGKAIHGNGYYDFNTNTSSPAEEGVGQTASLNDADQVFGMIDDGSGNYILAMRNGGTWTALTNLDANYTYTPYSISENGIYVAGQTSNDAFESWPFIYNTQTQTLTVLDSPLYEYGAAYGVNNEGIAVGWMDDLPVGTVRMPAFFDADGNITLISESYGEASDINENNQIVGSIEGQPFIYTITGEVLTMYDYPADYFSAAFSDISDNGIATGYAETVIEGQGFFRAPIVFHSSLGAQPVLLKDVLTANGVDASTLDGIGYKISSDGKYLGGWGSGPAIFAPGWAVYFDDLFEGGEADNDDCDGAIAVSCGETVTGTTADATDSGGNAAPDRFYTYTGSGAVETVTVSLCGSSYDTYIRVFSDCTLTNEIAFNDDFCDLQSEVSFTSDGTSTYVIMVEGYDVNAGDFTMSVSCEEITDYCEPVLDCTDGDLITNVTFQGINNDSDCSPNGYADYTDQVANVEAGETYSMSVTVGAGWDYEAVMVWIDFNNNLVFEPSEYYFIGSNPGTTNTADIAIPAGTPEGEYRMRVRVGAVNPDLNDLPTFACNEDTVYGETEDYTINVGELGISDLNNSTLAIYPNPVKDILTISSKKTIENVSVYNMAGQQVLNNLKLSGNQVNVSSLPSGVYVFHVKLEGNQTETFKVVKK